MGINRAIARLAAFFAVAFALLALRALWIGTIAAPGLAADAHNPRALLLDRYRGDIVARDGTVLAHTASAGRTYPFGAALAHVIGYDSLRYGTSGLERAFDRTLSAPARRVDVASQLQELIATVGFHQARGDDVVTTIDLPTQLALYRALSAYARGAGVAIDPRNGEVLALASVPSFDPATVDTAFGSLAHRADSPLLDRATDGLYPPGSTFKVFTAAAALDSGTIAPADTFVDDGALPVGSFVVHDNEGEATGTQDLAGAFALSSNVDFAQIALKLGVDRWFEYAARFGLGRSTGFTLPVSPDRVPERASVTPSILAQLAFGQADLAVTPLRMALVTSTIAAGGIEPRPSLVRGIRASNGRVTLGPRASLAVPISPQTAAQVRDLMVAAVERGTGTAASLPGVSVAGKTGTATNPAGRSHAWFVAFAPAAAPRIAVAIVVENAGYGGVAAAPIARRVIGAAMRL